MQSNIEILLKLDDIGTRHLHDCHKIMILYINRTKKKKKKKLHENSIMKRTQFSVHNNKSVTKTKSSFVINAEKKQKLQQNAIQVDVMQWATKPI